MLRKKKGKDVTTADDAPAETETQVETSAADTELWSLINAAGQEYARELDEVANESLDGLREDRERVQAAIDEALQPLRSAETEIAAAYGRYLQALRVSDFGMLPGSQDAVRQAFDQYLTAYDAGLAAAQKADHAIGEILAQYSVRETEARTTAQERFAKAFRTYVLAYRNALSSADLETLEPQTVILAAQELSGVASFAAMTAATP